MTENKPIYVTSPLLPDFDEYSEMLRQIWDSRILTNNGEFHRRLERELTDFLGVQYMSLFTNGTLPLITSFQALELSGEVITTPYSFVATTHALWWNGIKPVFVDIDPLTCNIDPDKIEEAITPSTSAILAVHCYGRPCDTKRIREIGDKHGLKVIYDGAHAFGVEVNGKSLLEDGDLTTMSFHATKVYNTVEGGALVMHDPEMKQRIDYLKNFGFANEVTVVGPGINSKMDEVRAAFGLLNLRKVTDALRVRKAICEMYRTGLSQIPGITFFDDIPGVKHNYSHFPVFVEAEVYGMSRDDLYTKLKRHNIYARRYFYPLISDFEPYRNLPSAQKENLPNAHMVSGSVICLPLYPGLTESDVNRVTDVIKRR